jgi:hypothetical protein
VCAIALSLLRSLKCLFSPHQVNHGGVQNAPAEVSLYMSHTTEESLGRHRSGRYIQVHLSGDSGQVSKILLVLLPPHQRDFVLGHRTPVALSCRLSAGLALRERTGRHPWVWY